MLTVNEQIRSGKEKYRRMAEKCRRVFFIIIIISNSNYSRKCMDTVGEYSVHFHTLYICSVNVIYKSYCLKIFRRRMFDISNDIVKTSSLARHNLKSVSPPIILFFSSRKNVRLIITLYIFICI